MPVTLLRRAGETVDANVELTVLIPTRNEARWIEHCVRSVRASLEATETCGEVVVCDGGSEDGTRRAAGRAGACRVIEAAGGRGVESDGRIGRPVQINAGAGEARGRTLAILHADTLVRPEWIDGIRAARRRGCVAGWSGVEILPEQGAGALAGPMTPVTAAGLEVMAWGINRRTRLFRTATGDQGIFVDRGVFEQIGGVPEVPIMDGNALAARLREVARQAGGEVGILPPWLRISGRRWQRGGLVRTMLVMYGIRAGWMAGVAPETLRGIWERLG